MTTSSRQLVAAGQHPNTAGNGPQSLGFSVNLDSGRGLLTTRHRRIGPLVVDTLSLQIPHLAFPFDVSGGAARFRNRRCALVYLAMHVDAADLTACFSEHALITHGFSRLAATIADGFILLSGHFRHHDHAADFTCRVAPVVQGGREVHLVFYDTRVYGFLPMPGAHLTRYLWRSLRWPAWFTESPSVWRVRPVEAFTREMLPRGGWKIPTLRQLQELSIAAHQGELHALVGEEEQPGASGPEIPSAALVAADGIALHAPVELALHEGRLEHAYLRLRRAVDDGQGGAWAALRLLHLGAALPQFAADSRKYAQQFLDTNIHTVHARLALAALAVQSGNQAAAAVHFAALAQDAQGQQQFQDAAAAWLAQSHVQLDIDLEGARQAGNAAVGLMPQQPAGHAHMYRVHRRSNDLPQAAQSAERWAQHCDKTPASADMLCEFGAFFREQMQDFAKARRMYEHALARVPEHPPALSGLAELHLQRGDTGQAVTFFARLATHWEQYGDTAQAVACHLRLADIWMQRPGDTAAGLAHYKRVIELDPHCLPAVSTLADLVYVAGNTAEALMHYQAVIAADTAEPDAAPPQAVHAYEQAIKISQHSGSDRQQDQLQLAYLDRLLQLRPDHAEAAAMRLGMLRAQKRYARLAPALIQQARGTPDADAACELYMEAARLAQEELRDNTLLRHLCEAACALRPAHEQALAWLVPLLRAAGDWPTLVTVLTAAAAVTPDGDVRVRLWVALAHAQGAAGAEVPAQVATLRRALDWAPTDLPAAQAMVDTLAADNAADPQERARACEALAQAHVTPAEQAQAWMAAARHHGPGAPSVAAARHAVARVPALAAAHFLLIELLEAGDAKADVERAFAAATGHLRDGELAELFGRQAHWATQVQAPALQLQALLGLANMGRLTPDQALALVAVLKSTGEANAAVTWLEQWADAGAPLHPGEALLQAAAMLQAAREHARAHEILDRVLRHSPPYPWRAAQAMEQLAQAAREDTWLVQAWRAQIHSAPDDDVRAAKQGRLLHWQAEHRDPDCLTTARALLKTRPSHPLACHLLALHHDAEKAWAKSLEVRLSMLAAAPDAADAERRKAAYTQAAGIAADLRPKLLAQLQAGFHEEFPGGAWTCDPLSERLTAQRRWADLLALRQEQHRAEPENLVWQRAIATLLGEHFQRADEARNMWRNICAEDPGDVPSLHQWLQSAERAHDTVAEAAAHAALARQIQDPETAWQHTLTGVRLHADACGEPGAARALLRDGLARLAPPADVAPLVTALGAMGMDAAVLDLAPDNWRNTRNSPAWTERIEQALRGMGKCFEHMAFVLAQAPLGTYEPDRAMAILRGLLAQSPAPKLLPEHSLVARSHAFCALQLRTHDPEAALEHCRQALPRHPTPGHLEDLYEKLLLSTGRGTEAAEFRLAQARRAGLGAEARAHFEALADLCADHLNDPARARWALEQAVHQAPRDVRLLRRLVNMVPVQEHRAFVAAAEALMAVSVDARQDVELLQKLAAARADTDRPRAIALLRTAMTLAPADAAIREKWEALSNAPWQTEPPPLPSARAKAAPASPAPEPSAAPAATPSVPDTVAPAAAATPPEPVAASPAPAPAAPAADSPSRASAPSAPTAMVVAKAKDPVLQNIAAEKAALAREPDNLTYRERYAAACAQSRDHLPVARAAYLDLLARDGTHTPWLRVLARVDGALQNSVGAYGFYAALLAVQPDDNEAQRFVGACRQLRSDLPARPFTNMDWDHIRDAFTPLTAHGILPDGAVLDIAPRALSAIAPSDPKVAPLTALLSYLGISQPPLRLWPAGGRQCAVTSGEEKMLMLGAALYNDMPTRAGVFLALRSILQAHDAEIHPAHGNNAAMLLAADVAEALDALCAAQGMVLAPHASRAALIKKTPELLDLLRFAQSPAYLTLNAELQLK